jgi:hypothetical protein
VTAPLDLDDDEIETMVRALIEAYLANDARAAALDSVGKADSHLSGGAEPRAARR